MLHAVIETDRDPAGGFWDLVLTGVGRDGDRYVLAAGSGGNSTFEGTAFDWLIAVLR